MSVMREEFHHLVDGLPEDEVASVLALVRLHMPASWRRQAAITAIERVRVGMSGVTDVDEELDGIRDSFGA